MTKGNFQDLKPGCDVEQPYSNSVGRKFFFGAMKTNETDLLSGTEGSEEEVNHQLDNA